MDFIDPKKEEAHKRRLAIGYGLMVVLMMLASVILLYVAYGYGFGKDGQIIQNGFVYLSSNPNPAQIYVNNLLLPTRTNSRLQLPAGQYMIRVSRNGYRPWQRIITVNGGGVEFINEPFLFPTELTSSAITTFTSQPEIMTQSPDLRWLVLKSVDQPNSFTIYDLSNPTQLNANKLSVSVPAGILSVSKTPGSYKVIGWAGDNRHILMQRSYDSGSEYILFDRQTPEASVNLTKLLNLAPSIQLQLFNKHLDQYTAYNPVDQSLSSLTQAQPTPQLLVAHVLSYQTYGSDSILYVTPDNAPLNKVNVKLQQAGKQYLIKSENSSSTYLLGISQYNGSTYVLCGAPADNEVMLYKDPAGALSTNPSQHLVPDYIFHLDQPQVVSFSPNSQYAISENGSTITSYDIQDANGYKVQVAPNLNSQQQVAWMDGSHLVVNDGNKTQVMDYDGSNNQVLNTAIDNTPVFFDPSYKWLYSLSPAQPSGVDLTITNLRIPADQ